MPIASLVCPKPIRLPTPLKELDHARLDRANALHDAGQFLESAREVLSYALGEDVPALSEAPVSFVQGSARMTLRLEGDLVHSCVPMVRLRGDGNPTALLRFMLSRASGSGQLHQPRLRGDELTFEYSERLERLQPTKLLELVRRMPVEADNTDDWLVAEFGAEPLDPAPIKPLDDAEADAALSAWRIHWTQVDELLKEAQRKRSMFFLNEVTSWAFNHVRFAFPLVGALSQRLVESAHVFNDAELDPVKRESSLNKCLGEMSAISDADLIRNLGHAHYSISPLAEGTNEVLTSCLGDGEFMTTIQRLRAAGRSMEAAVALIGAYNFLLARYAWPEPVEVSLAVALFDASERPWREAASVLFASSKEIAASAKKRDTDAEEVDA
jgi:hypothetical protein